MTLEPRPIIQSHDPTLYELRGENVCITYSTSSINGQPQFSYQALRLRRIRVLLLARRFVLNLVSLVPW